MTHLISYKSLQIEFLEALQKQNVQEFTSILRYKNPYLLNLLFQYEDVEIPLIFHIFHYYNFDTLNLLLTYMGSYNLKLEVFMFESRSLFHEVFDKFSISDAYHLTTKLAPFTKHINFIPFEDIHLKTFIPVLSYAFIRNTFAFALFLELFYDTTDFTLTDINGNTILHYIAAELTLKTYDIHEEDIANIINGNHLKTKQFYMIKNRFGKTFLDCIEDEGAKNYMITLLEQMEEELKTNEHIEHFFDTSPRKQYHENLAKTTNINDYPSTYNERQKYITSPKRFIDTSYDYDENQYRTYMKHKSVKDVKWEDNKIIFDDGSKLDIIKDTLFDKFMEHIKN